MTDKTKSYYQVKVKLSGKHKNPNVRFKSNTQTGIVAVEKKCTLKELENFILSCVDLTDPDPDVTLSASVELKKFNMDLFMIYK